jgi:hypothetical protein
MQDDKNAWFRLFALSLLLILVCLPRFNRNSLIIKRGLDDAAYYIAYTEYFRGETPSAILAPASNWRPLVPFIASFLPLQPLTAIDIINIVFLVLSLFILFKILNILQIKDNIKWLGCLLFILSFPTFYYGAIGYVDPGVLLFITLGSYFILQKKWNWLIPTIILGLLAKETIFIILPAAIVYLFLSTSRTKAFIYSILYVSCYILVTMLIRKFAPFTGNANPQFWHFSFAAFEDNLLRINVYFSLMLSLGVPAIIFVLYPLRSHIYIIQKMPYMLACLAAIATGLGMWFFSFLTAAADGRIIWMIYPFIIPYVALLLDYEPIKNLLNRNTKEEVN